MSLLSKRTATWNRKAPPEFEWVSIQMDVTRWVITAALGTVALGVWAGVWRINDLGYAINSTRALAVEQEAVNKVQDKEISDIQTAITKHQVYLEQILQAVRSDEFQQRRTR